MKYTKTPTTTFKKLGLNAGVILTAFDPADPKVEDEKILGATSGGNTFAATPSFIDFGEDVDNCPKNTMELMQCDDWDIALTGTLVTMDEMAGQRLLAVADIDGTNTHKIVPRRDLKAADFKDIWFVGDYSDKTGATNGGFIAVHLKNALSVGGFSLVSTDKGKMKFAFNFKAHFSLKAQDEVPFELYIQAGTDEA